MNHNIDASRYVTLFLRQSGRSYVHNFMQEYIRMHDFYDDDGVFHDGEDEEMEHINTTLIQELFEVVAEDYIENDGNVAESKVELLNNLIEVLFFE